MEKKNRRKMLLNVLDELKYWLEQVAGKMEDQDWEEAVIETEIDSFKNRIDVIYNKDNLLMHFTDKSTEGDEA